MPIAAVGRSVEAVSDAAASVSNQPVAPASLANEKTVTSITLVASPSR